MATKFPGFSTSLYTHAVQIEFIEVGSLWSGGRGVECGAARMRAGDALAA